MILKQQHLGILILFLAVFASRALNAAPRFNSARMPAAAPTPLASPVPATTPVPTTGSTAAPLTEDDKPKLLPLDQPGFGAKPEAQNFDEVCSTVRLEKTKDFDWKDMEHRLICGDDKSDPIGEPWAKIPPNQASYFLRGFLQARGYHQPEFIQDGEVLYVRPGPLSRLNTFRLLGGPATWDPPRRRLVKGLPLTPPLLNDLQAWSLSQIKNEGYACATAASQADPRTEEALVELTPGRLEYFTTLETIGDSGLAEGALNRYNAFRLGDIYRERFVELTKRRTQQDGFLQTLVLTPKCDPDGLRLVRDVVLGPSRSVSIGAGGNTEEGPLVKATVRQNRIGDLASSATGTLRVSRLDNQVNYQSVNLLYHWYYSPDRERSFVEPSVSFIHEAVPAYDARTWTAKAVHGWNQETEDGQYEVRLGPNFLNTTLARGKGPASTALIYGEATARWLSHDFEYFNTSPRTGELLEASVLVTQKRWGANFTAQKFRLNGHKLWPIFRYDPPLLIIATRFDVDAVFSPDEDITSDLPTPFLTFLGGEQNLRGYDRTSLPRDQLGSLSAATTSVEARLHKVIFRRADFFWFLDAGLLGKARFELQKPLFLSPGLGLRWESPIGVLRTYVAKRFVAQQPEDTEPYDSTYRIGFTFGEEF